MRLFSNITSFEQADGSELFTRIQGQFTLTRLRHGVHDCPADFSEMTLCVYGREAFKTAPVQRSFAHSNGGVKNAGTPSRTASHRTYRLVARSARSASAGKTIATATGRRPRRSPPTSSFAASCYTFCPRAFSASATMASWPIATAPRSWLGVVTFSPCRSLCRRMTKLPGIIATNTSSSPVLP